jgi:serine/threonine-protein kinase
MGVVYRGERLHLERTVAIKFLHAAVANDRHLRHRFRLETTVMGRLQHPNCVSVIDHGMADLPYLVMEFVHGPTLREAMRRGRLQLDRVLRLVTQVLAGLEHAHAQGVVHRDIKPDNIILAEVEGLGEQARILDFGLAKRYGSNASLAGVALGTPRYMAPEQCRAESVDGRADLYSVGIMLFELLVGRQPFEAAQVRELMRMQREQPAPLLGEACPRAGYSRELEAVLARALAKQPAERFGSAAELRLALLATPEGRSLAGGPDVRRAAGPATPLDEEQRFSRRVRRRRLQAVALASTVLVTVLALLFAAL